MPGQQLDQSAYNNTAGLWSLSPLGLWLSLFFFAWPITPDWHLLTDVIDNISLTRPARIIPNQVEKAKLSRIHKSIFLPGKQNKRNPTCFSDITVYIIHLVYLIKESGISVMLLVCWPRNSPRWKKSNSLVFCYIYCILSVYINILMSRYTADGQ